MQTVTEDLRTSAYQHFNAGRHWEAISACLRAITVAPIMAWPYYLMGLSHMRLGRKRDAQALLRRFVSIESPKTRESTERAQRLIAQIEEEVR